MIRLEFCGVPLKGSLKGSIRATCKGLGSRGINN